MNLCFYNPHANTYDIELNLFHNKETRSVQQPFLIDLPVFFLSPILARRRAKKKQVLFLLEQLIKKHGGRMSISTMP